MWKQKFMSRKFWVAVAGAALLVANEGLDLGIPKDTYWQIVTLVLGYIFGESVVDVARAKTEQKDTYREAVERLKETIESVKIGGTD